jgi:hypothetical protein
MKDWNQLKMVKPGHIPPEIWNELVGKVRAATIESIIGGKLSTYPDGGTTLEIDPSPPTATEAPPAPLTLTLTPPLGWTPPDSDASAPDNVPFRCWLTFGTVDYTTPERADGKHALTTPVVEIPRNITETTAQRVYLECEWPGPTNQYALWTHIWLKTQPSTDTFPAPEPIGANGWRPKFYLLLGAFSVTVSGTGSAQTKTPTVYNTDQGSFRSFIQAGNGYVQFTAADLPEHPPQVTMVRDVVFFRNQRATA